LLGLIKGPECSQQLALRKCKLGILGVLEQPVLDAAQRYVKVLLNDERTCFQHAHWGRHDVPREGGLPKPERDQGLGGAPDPAPIRGQSRYAASFSYSRFSFSSMNFISNSIGLT
jgi:hypothetical protein